MQHISSKGEIKRLKAQLPSLFAVVFTSVDKNYVLVNTEVLIQ